MKKKWETPKMYCLSVSRTEAVNVPGTCEICGKWFASPDQYEKHKVDDCYKGKVIGTECPTAPKEDNHIIEIFTPEENPSITMS